MKFKKKNSIKQKAGTIIGNGITLENVIIKGIGVVQIDSLVNGEISLEGHLIIGENGKVIGDVYANTATFLGAFEGNLHVDNTLHITSTAKVNGNINAGNLIVDKGAEFNCIFNVDKTLESKNTNV